MIVCSLVLQSCGGKQYSYDQQTKCILQTNGNSMDDLWISAVDSQENEIYSMNLRLPEKTGKFCMDTALYLDRNQIAPLYGDTLKALHPFALSNSKFIIKASGGDRAGFRLVVKSDAKGNIIFIQ